MARFGAILVALIAVTGWILAQGFTSPAERHAIRISAAIVVLVQLVTFAIVKVTDRRNAMLAGWGIGIVVRATALGLYGLLFAKLLGLPLAAALVSFVVFLFASMLLESFMIAYAR